MQPGDSLPARLLTERDEAMELAARFTDASEEAVMLRQFASLMNEAKVAIDEAKLRIDYYRNALGDIHSRLPIHDLIARLAAAALAEIDRPRGNHGR